MAIFTSTLVTSCKKKVGNLVTTKLRGQNILKSFNPQPTNPNTVPQQDSRVRMANAVLFWQYFSAFFASFKYQKTSVESIYNSFVRIAKNAFSTTVATTKALVVTAFTDGSYGADGKIKVTAVQVSSSSSTVSFETNDLAFIDGYYVHLLAIDTSNDLYNLGKAVIDSAAWSAGSVSVPVGINNPAPGLHFAICYANNDKTKDTTTLVKLSV